MILPYLFQDQARNEVSFFCQYIANDVIGPISNSHLAFADLKGPMSHECINLVNKASRALDFAKTGSPVFLENREKPSMYPDFMEKSDHKPSYESEKALGHLYRNIQQVLSVQDVKVKLNAADNIEVPGWEDFREDAEYTFRVYCKKVKHLINQFGLGSETEVFTGVVHRASDFNKVSRRLLWDRESCQVIYSSFKWFYCVVHLCLNIVSAPF